MTRLQRIKSINAKISRLKAQILDIERNCPHARIRVQHAPDIYQGQGGNLSCADCGKFFSRWTVPIFDGKAIKKTRIVKNVGTAENPKLPETPLA